MTILNGSVDVTSAIFVVAPNPNSRCSTLVAVPEPNGPLLVTLGGGIGLAFSHWNRRRK